LADMLERPLNSDHPDYLTLAPIACAILAKGGDQYGIIASVPQLIRTAIDEVIDAPRTNRFTLGEIEKTEKTYLGTKIEILLRSHLGLPKGQKLDLNIDGTEVDIKNTMGNNWSIPGENVGHPAILIRSNEQIAKCDFGLIFIREPYLNSGKNRDGKRTISANSITENVWWILKDCPYPPNFWERLTEAEKVKIMAAGGGTQRIATLFERYQGQVISRTLVQAVSQQKDYMKRIRRKGGARDILAPKGIAILWGRGDREVISQLNLGPVDDEEFISFKPTTADEIDLLRRKRHID
jgi:hypothetical protein